MVQMAGGNALAEQLAESARLSEAKAAQVEAEHEAQQVAAMQRKKQNQQKQQQQLLTIRQQQVLQQLHCAHLPCPKHIVMLCLTAQHAVADCTCCAQQQVP